MNNEKKFIKLTPFKMQVLQSFPFIDADFDAITNYELLCKVVEYLNTTVDNVNLLNDKVEEFEHYFDNLDVQEEINNKLDDMAESGELADIIAQYLQLAGVLAFNTVADMKQATNLVNGSTCRTLGYYNVNDGGGATYKITNVINTNEYQEELENGLYATLIHLPNYINVKTLGCKTDDNTFDNSIIINNAIKERTTLFFPYGEYFINNPIVITKSHVNIIGENERTRITKTSSNGTDITIETSKGTTYNLNNYDMCFYVGKETSSSDTLSLVKIKNISIKCFDSTDTSHGIIIIGCGYFSCDDIQLIDYNRGILIDDSFAINLNRLTALTFGSNRSAIEIHDSTAVYVSNSYLSARYYSLNISNSRVYADNIACDAHGYVFLVKDNSYFDMINSRCETYANVMNCETNSYCNISNCDLEGHGTTFEWFIKSNIDSNVVIKNSVIRYRVYEGEETPASVNLFKAENNSIVNVESYLKTPNITLVKTALTGGSINFVDLNIDGKIGNVTTEANVTITDKEIDIKDGYVNIYISGRKSDGLTKDTSVNIGTLTGLPFPPLHAHRCLCGTSQNNAYSTNNPAYCGINTSGVLSILTSVENQQYFVICTRYKIR